MVPKFRCESLRCHNHVFVEVALDIRQTGEEAAISEMEIVYKLDSQAPIFSTWMAFGGNTRDLGSFGEETNEITNLHQIHEEILFSERGDGVTGIKRRRRDPSSDGVRDLVTASGRG
ncbi:hypothetical protein Tco_0200226 [Tanacetum coccineum]